MKRDRLTILREAQETCDAQAREDALWVKQTRSSTQCRDDPAYRAKVLAFEHSMETVPTFVGVDPAAPGGDRTTYSLTGNWNVTPGKTHTTSGGMVPNSQNLPKAKRCFQVGDRVRVVNGCGHTLPQGRDGEVTGVNGPFITLTTHGGGWLADRFELVEAVGTTAPAAPAVETYSVCIKAHCVWSVGEVVAGSLVSRPECWLPCDKDGWVTHDPQPDSVCPVPVSVSKFEAQRRDGSLETTTDAASWQLGSPGDRTPNKYDIVAWRPVKS